MQGYPWVEDFVKQSLEVEDKQTRLDLLVSSAKPMFCVDADKLGGYLKESLYEKTGQESVWLYDSRRYKVLAEIAVGNGNRPVVFIRGFGAISLGMAREFAKWLTACTPDERVEEEKDVRHSV